MPTVTKHYSIDQKHFGKILSSLGFDGLSVTSAKIYMDATSATLMVTASIISNDNNANEFAMAIADASPQEVSTERLLDQGGREYVELDGERWYR